MEPTEEQKVKNYDFMVEALKRLRAGIPPTEDTEQADWRYFKGMRQVIGNFNDMHPEVTDAAFRAKANDMEQIARYLDMYTDETGHIHYGAYLQMLERANYMVEYSYPDEMDVLASAFKKNKIT